MIPLETAQLIGAPIEQVKESERTIQQVSVTSPSKGTVVSNEENGTQDTGINIGLSDTE